MHVASDFSMKNLVHAHDLARPGNGQQPQRRPIQHRKNSRIHSYSQRNRQHRRHREPRILLQCSRTVSQIAPKRFQRPKAPHLPANLLHPHRVSKFPPRRVFSLSRRNSSRALLLLAHRQVKFELFLQIPLQLLPMEQRLHSRPRFHGHFSKLSGGPYLFGTSTFRFSSWYLLPLTPFASPSQSLPTSAANTAPLRLIPSVPLPSANRTSRVGCSPNFPTPPTAAHATPACAAPDTVPPLPHAARRSNSHESIPPRRNRASPRAEAPSAPACPACLAPDRPVFPF